MERDREYSEEELDGILESLELYHFQIDKPKKRQIDNCVESLYQYMPSKISFVERLGFIINEVKLELSYFNKFQLKWLVAIMIMFMVLVVTGGNKPETMFLSLAAVPTVIGFLSLNKSKGSKMLELELSLKRSWKNRMFTKLLINYGISLIILVIMGIWGLSNGVGTDIIKYLSMSLSIIGVLSIISLWVLFYSRGLVGSIVTIILWLIISGGPLYSTWYFSLLEKISTINYIVGSLMTTGLFIYCLIKLTKSDYDVTVQIVT